MGFSLLLLKSSTNQEAKSLFAKSISGTKQIVFSHLFCEITGDAVARLLPEKES